MKDFRLEDDTALLVKCTPTKAGKDDEKHDQVKVRLSRQGDDALLACLVPNVKQLQGLLWDKQGHRISAVQQVKCDLAKQNMRVRLTRLHHDPIELAWAKVHKFAIDIAADDMGMCDVSFEVQAEPAAPQDVGLLCHYAGELMEITIIPEDEARADDSQADVETTDLAS